MDAVQVRVCVVNQERRCEMKEWIEGWLMCLGIGLFYLAAGAAEQGHDGWALALFGMGFGFLSLMLLLVVERR